MRRSRPVEEIPIFELLGDLGDFIGGIGVVVTLLYLATQIRQNTRALQTASRQAISHSSNIKWIHEVLKTVERESSGRPQTAVVVMRRPTGLFADHAWLDGPATPSVKDQHRRMRSEEFWTVRAALASPDAPQ